MTLAVAHARAFANTLPTTSDGVLALRVHVLYKRPEIPANKVVPAICRFSNLQIQEEAENPGSIPVSATNSFIIQCLYNQRTRRTL
jgi:hypothetical protein